MKSLADLLADWRDAVKEAEKYNARTPNVIGNEVVKAVMRNFDSESYDTGTTKIRWPKRSEETDKAYDKRRGVKGSVFSSGNKLLQQTWNLRDGVKYRVNGQTIFVGVNIGKVPYAQIHNEGGKIEIKARSQVNPFQREGSAYSKTVKIAAHTIMMPQRQFMPMPGEKENPAIIKAVLRKLNFDMGRIMIKFKK